MRGTRLQISIAIFTFAMGLSTVWIVRQLPSIQLNPILVDEAKAFLPGYEKARFSPTGRGCGAGYSQFYETDDGQELAEGVRWNPSDKRIRQEFLEQIRNAKEIIERVPNYPNPNGDVGERIVIVNKADESVKESVSILWYDGGDSFRFIDAPSLALGLEFEKYLISINYRSPF